jgi:hypothetical protein
MYHATTPKFGGVTPLRVAMGEGATVIGEAQLRERMDRLSVLHDQNADLWEKIMTIISEGGDPKTREELHRRRQQ